MSLFGALLLLSIAASSTFGVGGYSILTPLAQHVKANSDPDVAPLSGPHRPLRVLSAWALLNVAQANGDGNFIEMESVIRLQWDTGIRWDPDEYAGIDTITLPSKYFWVPRIQQLTSAVRNEAVSPPTVTIYCNGTARHVGFFRSRILCDVSTVATGATCRSRTCLWGYSKDQVEFGVLSRRNATNTFLSYFQGSKYRVTDAGMKFTELPFDGKVFQAMDAFITIQEKSDPQSHEPLEAFFQWGH